VIGSVTNEEGEMNPPKPTPVEAGKSSTPLQVDSPGGGSSNSARKRHRHAVHQVNLVSVRPRMPPITFTDKDFKGIDPTQDDPMVISVDIDNFTIKKALVDQGSSVDILYWKTFKAMRIPVEEMMPYNNHVVGFSGERVGTKGYIELYITFDLEEASKSPEDQIPSHRCKHLLQHPPRAVVP